MDCLDENLIAELVGGNLSETRRARAEAHMDACSDCRALVADLASHDGPKAVAPAERSVHGVGGPGAPLPEQADEPAPESMAGGRRIGERYRLLRKIGQGGMGAVWVAQDEKLARPVAVKVMTSKTAHKAQHLARFEREAMAIARLRSPYIVQVHDYGVDEGRPYIVMELLEGEDLSDRLDNQGTLPLEAVARLVGQIARALAVAHEEGIVHRDLKPGNVFLVRAHDEELVKVVDFGVAKALNDLADLNDTTAEGMLLGTPRYMSPEQANGQRAVDHRCDLWALAVIAYRALTGRMPFDGAGVGQVLARICGEEPEPPSKIAPQLPFEVDGFFAKALNKEAGQRFQSARELCEALARVADVSMPSHEFSRGLSMPPQRGEGPTVNAQRKSNDNSATFHGATRAADEQRTATSPSKTRWALVGLSLIAAAVVAAVAVLGRDQRGGAAPAAGEPVSSVAAIAQSAPPPAIAGAPASTTSAAAEPRASAAPARSPGPRTRPSAGLLPATSTKSPPRAPKSDDELFGDRQ